MGVCTSKAAEDAGDDFDIEEQEEEIQVNYEVGQQLKQIPLLAHLSEKERGVLGAALEQKTFSHSQDIVIQGEPGNEFFLIKEGACSIIRTDDGKETVVAELSAGDYFGESALINNDARNASVRAVGAVTCLSLNRTAFKKLLGSNTSKLKVKITKRAAVSAESGAQNAEQKFVSHAPPDAVKDKSTETLKMLNDAVRGNPLFDILDSEQKQRVFDEMWLVDVKQGDNIITQGELGNHFYVVHSGYFEIFVGDNKVSQGDKGLAFGELAMLYKQPRAASVKASKPSQVWAIDRWTFRMIKTESVEAKLRKYDSVIKSAFAGLLAGERLRVAEALEEVSYVANHTIFKQGDLGETFFIVHSGEVVVRRRETPESEEKELKRYGPGEFFGERALVRSEPRAAAAVTTTDTTLVYMHQRDFSLLLGPVERVFMERVASYDGQASSSQLNTDRKDRKTNEDEAVETYLVDIPFDDLRVIGTLGQGNFGHVELVADPDGNTYALKRLNKAQIVEMGQEEHVMSEKDAMAHLDHPFLIKLFNTYKDQNSLYFLLEVCLGGELFSVLRERHTFDYVTARFYAAGVVLAFEYMHSRGIIYRDLKPENLLLSDSGYIKVTDFGFAKKLQNGSRTWTLCGTPDYLAPEVIAQQGHGKAVDWWTLGILIYEMLASVPPFYDDNPRRVYEKILQGHINFNGGSFSKAAQDLIKKLLTQKSSKRLGVTNGGVKAIKNHQFFKGFNWSEFQSQKMKAPIPVQIKNKFDLSNFDEDYEEMDMPMGEYIIPPNNPNWDADF